MTSGPELIYLDHNATTPLDAGVRAAMMPFLGEVFGNPSSIHAVGRRARAFLDEARERLARTWGCQPGELVFTSGGTEANNLAVMGAGLACRERGRHLLVSAVEHAAVLAPMRWLCDHAGFQITLVHTDPFGRISADDVRRQMRPDTVLVSVMAANNEVGTLQPVREIGSLCRERGIILHTDAVQWFGKEPVVSIRDFGADLVAGCAHKLHGPKGAGVLYIRSPLKLTPMLQGGSQENERRAGTENLAGIAGLVCAFERFGAPPVMPRSRLEPLSGRLEQLCLAVEGVRRWGPELPLRLANTLAITVEGCDSLSLLAGLDLAGICASSGSACAVGALKPSHVLSALGASPDEAGGLVRFSLGRDTLPEEVEMTGRAFEEVAKRVRN